MKEKINLATKPGGNNDKRNALRLKLDSIRDQQATTKQSRAKVFDQLKVIQDSVQKKVCLAIPPFLATHGHLFPQIKDLNAAKAKAPFKTVDEVDERIEYVAALCCPLETFSHDRLCTGI